MTITVKAPTLCIRNGILLYMKKSKETSPVRLKFPFHLQKSLENEELEERKELKRERLNKSYVQCKHQNAVAKQIFFSDEEICICIFNLSVSNLVTFWLLCPLLFKIICTSLYVSYIFKSEKCNDNPENNFLRQRSYCFKSSKRIMM